MLAQIFGQGIPTKAVANSIDMGVWMESLRRCSNVLCMSPVSPLW